MSSVPTACSSPETACEMPERRQVDAGAGPVDARPRAVSSRRHEPVEPLGQSLMASRAVRVVVGSRKTVDPARRITVTTKRR